MADPLKPPPTPMPPSPTSFVMPLIVGGAALLWWASRQGWLDDAEEAPDEGVEDLDTVYTRHQRRTGR